MWRFSWMNSGEAGAFFILSLWAESSPEIFKQKQNRCFQND